MKKLAVVALFWAACLLPKAALAQSFFNIDSIQLIELFFHQTNWDYLLDTAKQGTEETYLIADSVRVNGSTFDSVGVKYKGNSSYSGNNKKNPLHIELNTVHKNADYKGNSDIKLGNGFADPSFVREPLSYEIVRQYMDAPRSNFARLYINGEYFGVYTNAESINKDFLDELNFPPNNVFVKCNPRNAGPGSGTSNLGWLGADSTSYFNRYEIKSDHGWKELVQLIDTLNNKPAAIEQVFDIDKALWMHALNNVMINGDSYTGAFSQNYYLYRDGNRRFAPVMWDFNMSFGGFPLGGNGPFSSNLSSMQQLTPLYYETNNDRPLISKLLANATWKKMYMAHLRTIVEENFANGEYATRAEAMMATIADAVEDDTKKFFSNTQFQNSLDQSASGGGPGSSAVGIRQLMGTRATFLQAHAEFVKTPPALTAPEVSPASPALGSSVTVTASAPGASYVRLGWRPKRSLKFSYVDMKDDGLHGDGAANDGEFGASMPVQGVVTDFFVYAENALAGVFSPRRAEYEFHKLTAQSTQIQPGEVVINEFLASNTAVNTDPDGNFSDWVELYNNSDSPKDLSDAYLSDDWTNPDKWSFPNNTVIPAHGYLLVWANGGSNAPGLHADFKLTADGEQLALTSSNGLVRLDSLEFAAQTPNQSWERCPDGVGDFEPTLSPTPGAANCSVPTHAAPDFEKNWLVWPNPADDFAEIRFPGSLAQTTDLTIFNAMGQLVFSKNNYAASEKIDLQGWPAGLYFLKTNLGFAGVLAVARD